MCLCDDVQPLESGHTDSCLERYVRSINKRKWTRELRAVATSFLTAGAGIERCVQESVNPFEDRRSLLLVMDWNIFVPIHDMVEQRLDPLEFNPVLVEVSDDKELVEVLMSAKPLMEGLHEKRGELVRMVMEGPSVVDEKTMQNLRDQVIDGDVPTPFWRLPLSADKDKTNELMEVFHGRLIDLYELYLAFTSQLDFKPSKRIPKQVVKWHERIVLHCNHPKCTRAGGACACGEFLSSLSRAVIPQLYRNPEWSGVFPVGHMIVVKTNTTRFQRDPWDMSIYLPNPKGPLRRLLILTDSWVLMDDNSLIISPNPLLSLLQDWVAKYNTDKGEEVVGMIDKLGEENNEDLVMELAHRVFM
jgi:hypothetical protein